MDKERQKQAPIYTALERFRLQRVVPFDVPGHKRGRGNPELVQLLGEKCVGIDVNSMKPLDNLCHPVSVIREAEDLAADAFGAAHAFLMVGGTTSSVQGMVLSTCKPGDKIILPRNVHKSAINALVLCGATPVYIDPKVDKRLGIPLGMEVEDVRAAMEDVEQGRTGDVPRHLQNVHADSAGSGPRKAYQYPHDFPKHWVEQQYLPDAVKGARYYEYGENRTEQAAKAYWERIKGRKP